MKVFYIHLPGPVRVGFAFGNITDRMTVQKNIRLVSGKDVLDPIRIF